MKVGGRSGNSGEGLWRSSLRRVSDGWRGVRVLVARLAEEEKEKEEAIVVVARQKEVRRW